jgi:hypothetical protein
LIFEFLDGFGGGVGGFLISKYSYELLEAPGMGGNGLLVDVRVVTAYRLCASLMGTLL